MRVVAAKRRVLLTVTCDQAHIMQETMQIGYYNRPSLPLLQYRERSSSSEDDKSSPT